MVLTLAPFSGVNVTSKIALWEMVCIFFERDYMHIPFAHIRTH